MDATISNEDDDGCGVRIVDLSGVEHWVEFEYDTGEVTYYEQDGYPEPNKRTDEQDVHVEQAVEHAKWYVQRQRGYNTLAPRLTPEWLALVAGAVASLSSEQFRNHFGAYTQQYHSQLRPTISPVVELPHNPDGAIVFRADTFVSLAFQEYLEDPDTTSPISAVETETDPSLLFDSLRSRVRDLLMGEGCAIEEISEIDILYQTAAGEQTTGERSSKIARPADARLEMVPPQVTLDSDLSMSVLQTLVLHHLQCQVRDAYLRICIEPPEAFRILGHGMYRQTVRYEHLDIYSRYHYTDAEIEGYRQPGDTISELSEAATLDTHSQSLSESVKNMLFGG